MAKDLPMESPGAKPKVISGLMIHENVVCHAVRDSGRYAKLAASKMALDHVHGLALYEFRERFGCDCKPAAVGEPVVKLEDMGTAI